MKITIENTTKMVTITFGRAEIQARVWEGETESGIKVACLIPRIAADGAADQSQFERELEKQGAPTMGEVCPQRMLL